MHRLVLQLLAFFPGDTTIGGFEKTAGLIVPVRAHVKNLRIARIDDDVIDEEFGFAEIVEQLPLMAAVRRRVDLAVERAEVKPIWIRRIDDKAANVASRRAGRAPVI